MEVNIDIILGVILIALFTEGIVSSFKRLLPETASPKVPVIIAMVVSVLLCMLTKLDLMTGFGYPLTIQYGIYIGAFFSGVLASLGASAIYNLYDGFNEYKDKLAVEKHIEKTTAKK